MIEPGKQSPRGHPVRQPMLLGLFVGTAVGAGYLLAGVPNVELMTLVIALSGVALGPGLGALCGALSALIYSLGSPYGLPIPLLLGAQMSGMACSGWLGWWLMRTPARRTRWSLAVRAGLGGCGVTLVYDLLTTLATVGAFDLDLTLVVTGGIPFALWHMGVNTALFMGLFPQLAPRMKGLGRPALQGSGRLLGLVLAGTLVLVLPTEVFAAEPASPAVTPVDSLGPAPDLPADSHGPGWRRPLWQPFAPHLMQELLWRGRWQPLVDGGLGAPVRLLGEGGTSANPLILRDGVPLGTGHLLTDDPWLAGIQDQVFGASSLGSDGWGGTDGVIHLTTADTDPTKAISYYRGVKGPHESFQRAAGLLTPRAAWRLGFAFEENLDLEAYNPTPQADELFYNNSSAEFPGHARLRQSRTVISRQLDPDNRLQVEYTTARKTKDSLPAWGVEHQEIWDSAASARMDARLGGWQLGSIFFWRVQDMQWGDREGDVVTLESLRKISSGRQGVVMDLVQAEGPTGFKLIYNDWDLHDTGAVWAPQQVGAGSGQSLRLAGHRASRLGPLTADAGVSGTWHDRQGLAPGGYLSLSPDGADPGWRATVAREGRFPRSDELLTPLRRLVNGRTLSILPNSELSAENTLRAGLELQRRVIGLDFAVDGSVRRLTEGISWVASSVDPDQGQLANVLDLDSTRLTAAVSRQGRFLGWLRLKLQGTWQSFDEKSARAAFLPPTNQWRLELLWENHFFQEDGILQVALYSTRRGEMTDPWDPTRTEVLPSVTGHDLVLGFRLVGAHLALGILNLTDQRLPQTAGTLSPGREMDLRLNWTFQY